MIETGPYARMGLLLFFLVSSFSNSSSAIDTQKSAYSSTDEQAILYPINEPFKGDLDKIRKRRRIRVLVSYCKTNYFFDHGKPRGFEYEMLKAYEKFLNRKQKNSYSRTRMIFLPVPFDRILSDLNKGRGDIAASSLTITPERQKIVDFTRPYIPRVDEIVVLNKNVKDLQSVDDLSNRMVYVRKGSSYVTHLKALNVKLKKMKQPPVNIIESQDYIVTEDILQLVNAGIVGITVADRQEAEAWSQVLPDIVIRKDLKINSEGSIAWAVQTGTKYLNFLRTRYFSSPKIAPADCVFFSWAAYNAGPAKIYKMRQVTRERGFDPNKWFFNVEKITDEFIGRETVDYVSDINKYYVAYQLYFNLNSKRTKIKKSLHNK
jgi:membrane-bound lytic murein transglycosylase MltF